MDARSPGTRTTLDGQLVDFWTREAARLDALAEEARFGWQQRRYARKAATARSHAERSRAREMARGRGEGTGKGAAGEIS